MSQLKIAGKSDFPPCKKSYQTKIAYGRFIPVADFNQEAISLLANASPSFASFLSTKVGVNSQHANYERKLLRTLVNLSIALRDG